MRVGRDKQWYYLIRNKNDINLIHFKESFPTKRLAGRNLKRSVTKKALRVENVVAKIITVRLP